MPGKVNPVLPMTMCQVALAICGNDLSVSLASQQGLLELNHYELLIADRLLDSMSMLSGAIAAFRQRCIDGIEANEERSWDHLRNSSALATVLVAEMGYAEVSALVQKARESGQTFIDHAVATGVLTDAQVRAALSRAIRSREP
jgi:aspartate ammonia-lyase